MPKPRTVQSYEQRINRVLERVMEDLTREYPLEALAEIACMSPFHLHRIFGAMMGEPPAAFIRRIRLLTAAQALQFRPTASVTDIAHECGFSSSQNFARAFRVWSGVSPSAFRDYCSRNRLPPLLEAQKSKFGNAAPFVLEYLAQIEGNRLRVVPNQPVLAKGVHMNVEVKELPAWRLAYVRHIGPYSSPGLEEAWSTVLRWGQERGLVRPGDISVGISRDNPELTDRCRYDACIVLPDDFSEESQGADAVPVNVQTLPGGLHACYRRPVRREEFFEAMNELFGIWLPQSGYECLGAPVELYHNTMEGLQNGTEVWDVSLCVPVRPMKGSAKE